MGAFPIAISTQRPQVNHRKLGIVHKPAQPAMKTQATFSSWDFAKTRGISSAINQGYPYLRNTISSGTSGGLVGQMLEVSLAGVLPLLGLVGVDAFWLRRRQSVK